jgi:hypothetical protein
MNIRKWVLRMFSPLFIVLILSGCSRATPTPLVTRLTVEPPTATALPILTSTPILPSPTFAPTENPPLQPLATVILTPTDQPVNYLEPAWTFAAEAPIWGPVTVSNGIVYFGSDDGYVYAVDSQFHSLIWKFKTGGIVRSRATVSNNLVYATSDDGFLYALSADGGLLAWKTQIGDPTQKREPQFSFFGANTYNSLDISPPCQPFRITPSMWVARGIISIPSMLKQARCTGNSMP